MKTVERLAATVDVGGWFEAGEEGPEKFLQRGGGLGGRVDKEHNRPGSDARVAGEARSQVRLGIVGRALHDQGAWQEGHRS